MTKNDFLNLLSKEVMTYKHFLETDTEDWIVKGFIDVNKMFILSQMIQK